VPNAHEATFFLAIDAKIKVARINTVQPTMAAIVSRIYAPSHYAFNLPSLKSFTKLELHPKATFFVDENGSGKSTMLEAIAIANGLNA